jgi:hypothetical protein
MSFATPVKQSASYTVIASAPTTAKAVVVPQLQELPDTPPPAERARKRSRLPTTTSATELPSAANLAAKKPARLSARAKPVASETVAAVAIPVACNPVPSLLTSVTYKVCAVCKLTTRFCCLTGLPHEVALAPCGECGLTSRFCPNTGKEHVGYNAGAKSLTAHATPLPLPAVKEQENVKEQEEKKKKKARSEKLVAPMAAVDSKSEEPPTSNSAAVKPQRKARVAPGSLSNSTEPSSRIHLQQTISVGPATVAQEEAPVPSAEQTKKPPRSRALRKPAAAPFLEAEAKATTLLVDEFVAEQASEESSGRKRLQKRPLAVPAAVLTETTAAAPVALSAPCARCGVKVRLDAKRLSTFSGVSSPDAASTAPGDSCLAAPATTSLVPASHECVSCASCGQHYHRGCYLAETGLVTKKSSAAMGSDLSLLPCVTCRSSFLTPEAVAAAVVAAGDAAAPFVEQLLLDGFTVVPLSAATSDPIEAVGKKKQQKQEENTVTNESVDEASESKEDSDTDERETVLKTLKAQVMAYFHALNCSYELEVITKGSGPSLATGYSNFRERGAGRFEIIAPFIREAIQRDLLFWENTRVSSSSPTAVDEACSGDGGCSFSPKSLVGRVLTAALGSDLKFLSSGCFLSTPNSSAQTTHTDGPMLSRQHNLFPYAVNVFMPLVEVGPANGTEFYPGTQLADAALISRRPQGSGDATPLTCPLEAEAAGGASPVVAGKSRVVPSASPGYALLFDYRVLHRGMPNKTGEPRPCLYATFARPWYTDLYNFSTERFRKELHVAPHFLESRGLRAMRRDSQKTGE